MNKISGLLFLALVALSQADNPISNGVKKLEVMSNNIKKGAEAVQSSLEPSLVRFDKAMKHGLKIGKAGVQNVYNRALENLETIPVECQVGIKDSLLQLQTDADHTFLSCSNLTMAVQDLGNLVTFSGNMLLTAARSLQELTWFTNCFSWNPIKSLPCFFEWIGLVYQGTKGLIYGMGTFNEKLDETLLHMLKVVEYCQDRTVQKHSALSLMAPVHQCAKQAVPYNHYTVQNYL